MEILQVYMENSLRNFNYIVYSKQNNCGVFFDPLSLKLPFEKLPQDIKVTHFAQTHFHPDHIAGRDEILKMGAKEIILSDLEEFHLSQNEKIKAYATPGHVSNHICFMLIENNIPFALICGDTIFNAGVGNCRMGGDPNELFETITKISQNFSDEVILYSSHDYALTNLAFAKEIEPDNHDIDYYLRKRKSSDRLITTLGEEKLINPFFRTENKDIQNKLKTKNSRDTFIELRRLRDSW